MASKSSFWNRNSTSNNAWHSPAYHSYFEGYTEVKDNTGKKGKPKIKRVYTGTWFYCEETDKSWRRRKLMNTAAFLTAVVLFILGAAISGAGNMVWYTQLCEALAVILFFSTFYYIVNYWMTPRLMTVAQYKMLTKPYPVMLKASAAVVGLSVFVQLLYVFLAENDILRSVIRCVLFATSFIFFIILLKSANNMRFNGKNGNRLDLDGVEIEN